MSLLDDVRAAVGEVQTDPELLALRFERIPPLTFRLGPHEWVVRCSIQDPQKLKSDAVASAQAVASDFRVAFLDLRLLRVHPDDRRPPKGATAPWDGGILEILHWSQEADLTAQKLGTCVLRR